MFSYRPSSGTHSHQEFKVYWAFQNTVGRSSIGWKSVSHFHTASILSDSTWFHCFILCLMFSQDHHMVSQRQRGGRIKRDKEESEESNLSIFLCSSGQREGLDCACFLFLRDDYNKKKIRSTDLHFSSVRKPDKVELCLLQRTFSLLLLTQETFECFACVIEVWSPADYPWIST